MICPQAPPTPFDIILHKVVYSTPEVVFRWLIHIYMILNRTWWGQKCALRSGIKFRQKIPLGNRRCSDIPWREFFCQGQNICISSAILATWYSWRGLWGPRGGVTKNLQLLLNLWPESVSQWVAQFYVASNYISWCWSQNINEVEN